MSDFCLVTEQTQQTNKCQNLTDDLTDEDSASEESVPVDIRAHIYQTGYGPKWRIKVESNQNQIRFYLNCPKSQICLPGLYNLYNICYALSLDPEIELKEKLQQDRWLSRYPVKQYMETVSIRF